MRTAMVVALVLFLGWAFSDLKDFEWNNGKRFSVHYGIGGWWAKIEGHAYPFGAWRMDRGPYPFRWMAALEFPIERVTKDGPRR